MFANMPAVEALLRHITLALTVVLLVAFAPLCADLGAACAHACCPSGSQRHSGTGFVRRVFSRVARLTRIAAAIHWTRAPLQVTANDPSSRFLVQIEVSPLRI